MGRAQDLVIKEHATIQRHSKVRAEVSCGIYLVLEARNEHLLVVGVAHFERPHLSFTESGSKWNLNLLGSISSFSNLALVLEQSSSS